MRLEKFGEWKILIFPVPIFLIFNPSVDDFLGANKPTDILIRILKRTRRTVFGWRRCRWISTGMCSFCQELKSRLNF